MAWGGDGRCGFVVVYFVNCFQCLPRALDGLFSLVLACRAWVAVVDGIFGVCMAVLASWGSLGLWDGCVIFVWIWLGRILFLEWLG